MSTASAASPDCAASFHREVSTHFALLAVTASSDSARASYLATAVANSALAAMYLRRRALHVALTPLRDRLARASRHMLSLRAGRVSA